MNNNVQKYIYSKPLGKFINIEEYTEIIEEKSFGAGEDFTYMLEAVQNNGGIGTYIQAGINRYAPHHSNKFNFDNTG